MAFGKHLVQAVSFVYALQCLTGKVDNNYNNIHMISLLLGYKSRAKLKVMTYQ